jgi:hypothetical protein
VLGEAHQRKVASRQTAPPPGVQEQQALLTNDPGEARSAPGVDEGVMRQGHDVDQGGLNRARPALGYSRRRDSRRIAHSGLR